MAGSVAILTHTELIARYQRMGGKHVLPRGGGAAGSIAFGASGPDGVREPGNVERHATNPRQPSEAE